MRTIKGKPVGKMRLPELQRVLAVPVGRVFGHVELFTSDGAGPTHAVLVTRERDNAVVALYLNRDIGTFAAVELTEAECRQLGI